MGKVENGYARYFNLINKRKGPLYEDRFFAGRIETDESLLHVVRYVHLNCTSHRIVSAEQLVSYPWSSLLAYLGKRDYSFLEKKFVMNFFEDRRNYYDWGVQDDKKIKGLVD